MAEFNWWSFVNNNWGKLLGALLGLLFALLVILIGFWWTLFIVLCVLSGLYLGWRVDMENGLRGLIDKLFPPKDSF